MEYEVFLSPRARLDLLEIGRYLTDQSGEANSQFCDDLATRALDLRIFPECYAEVTARSNVRKRVFGSYLIFYRVNRATGKVEILRFWHGSRNPSTLRMKETAAAYVSPADKVPSGAAIIHLSSTATAASFLAPT